MVSEVALTLESLMSRAKSDVELKPERSSATGGVGSVVVVVEEPSAMVTLAGEEVEERSPAELILLAEAASVVEVELSLKKPGSTVVKSLLVESIGCEMVELIQVPVLKICFGPPTAESKNLKNHVNFDVGDLFFRSPALWSSQNVFGPPTAGRVVVDFKDRGPVPPRVIFPVIV